MFRRAIDIIFKKFYRSIYRAAAEFKLELVR